MPVWGVKRVMRRGCGGGGGGVWACCGVLWGLGGRLRILGWGCVGWFGVVLMVAGGVLGPDIGVRVCVPSFLIFWAFWCSALLSACSACGFWVMGVGCVAALVFPCSPLPLPPLS